MIVTTTFEVPGYSTVECLGLVRGITVRVTSAAQDFASALDGVFGGPSKVLIEMCEDSRKEAYDNMVAEAVKLEANAVVGVRYDTSSMYDWRNEVICYGTAVVVKKNL